MALSVASYATAAHPPATVATDLTSAPDVQRLNVTFTACRSSDR